MKDFLYLVQGSADNIKKYFHLKDRKNSDAIFMTYDKQIEQALFLPNSLWSNGRNKMLEHVLSLGINYKYYIFCDDDVEFISGSWDIFEKSLKTLNPAVAVPIFPKTKHTPLPFLSYQSFLLNDEQMIAIHHEVVKDRILVPYWDEFDKTHCWPSCEIQELLIQNFYFSNIIQFNNIEISNDLHRYDADENSHGIPITNKTANFRVCLREWFGKQFKNKWKDVSNNTRKSLLVILWRTLLFTLRNKFSKNTLYSISKNKLRHILNEDSEILQRFLKTQK
jgi:hypothetical protein